MAGERIELPPYTMWATTPVYRIKEDVVFGLRADTLVADSSDETYVVQPGFENRLDLIATSVYGIPELWWVLARVNNLVDPMEGFSVHQRIRVPTRNRLASKGLLSA